MRRSGRALIAVLGLLVASWPARASAAAPGEQYAVLVEGASGTPEYATMHRRWLDAMAGLLREHFKYDPAHLIVLAEKPQEGEEHATADRVRAVMARLAGVLKADDQLFIMLIGHGAGTPSEAKFNLVGPDLSVKDWGALLEPIAAHIAFVDTTSSSYPFLTGLAAPGRVLITATASYAQEYHTIFPEGFIKAFTDGAADLDKNGRVSLLEAFTYASKEVARTHEQDGTMATERAMVSDTGGEGRDAAGTGPDGTVAGLTYLDVVTTPTSSDPATQALLTRQQELTQKVEDLRRRRAMMSAADFDQQFEPLIIELSLVSRDLRRRSGGRQEQDFQLHFPLLASHF